MFLWPFLGAKAKLFISGSAVSRKGCVLLSASQEKVHDFPGSSAGGDIFFWLED